MKENQMNLEQMCAMINEMHKELETLKNALLEQAMVAEEKWDFPEDRYTVLAIWLLYDPKARKLFPIKGKKSWTELAERLSKYVGWTVDWHSLRKNYTRKDLKR